MRVHRIKVLELSGDSSELLQVLSEISRHFAGNAACGPFFPNLHTLKWIAWTNNPEYSVRVWFRQIALFLVPRLKNLTLHHSAAVTHDDIGRFLTSQIPFRRLQSLRISTNIPLPPASRRVFSMIAAVLSAIDRSVTEFMINLPQS